MPIPIDKLLDRTGWQILGELQRNARISLSDLGRKINLSTPATMERVRKLEEVGIVTGYRADLDATKLGLPILAFVRINTPTRLYPRFLQVVEQSTEIIECHHVAGADSFILKARLVSNAHLEDLLRRLSPFGETNTSIVLSSPLTHRPLAPQPTTRDS